MHNDDDKEGNLPTWNLSTTDDEENNKKNPINPDKPSPSASAKNETYIQPPIDAVPIVVTTYPVFPSFQYPFRLSSIPYLENHNQRQLTTSIQQLILLLKNLPKI